MYLKIYSVIFLCIVWGESYSQYKARPSLNAEVLQTKINKALQVGDMCPDIALQNIINGAVKNMRISDFRGKLVIIDFWATWCAPCVSAFPRLDSLQKRYEDKIQVISVTSEEKSVVEKFLKNLGKIRDLYPFVIPNDSVLRKLFKHSYLPHYVWIDKTGKVVATTEGKDVNDENIQKVLDGGILKSTKIDYFKDFEEGRPVFEVLSQYKQGSTRVSEQLQNGNLLYHSIFTKYLHGYPAYYSWDSLRLTLVNMTIANLYKFCFSGMNSEFLFASNDRLILEISDSGLVTSYTAEKGYLKGAEFLNWAREHTFCYELQIPAKLYAKRHQIMLEDLNRYFGSIYGIKGEIVAKKMKCLVLNRISDVDKIKSKTEGKEAIVNRYSVNFKNGLMDDFINCLKKVWQVKSTPLLNETNYNFPIDIEINCDLLDINELNKELLKYDLQFVEVSREFEMIVLKSKE